MPAKSRFMRFDAFTKTVEDARVRTSSGGVVTIVSLVVMLYLVWGEWADYRRIRVVPELVVDKGRGERMEIHMNISFPRMPCELLTLDVMDVSGEMQMGVMTGVNKVRLRPMSEGSGEIAKTALVLHTEQAEHLSDDYCGDCYGAPPPATAKKPGCCNTCQEVRDAYAGKEWAFGRSEGEHIAQCRREHWVEHLDEQKAEGCRIEGGIRVNKVVGNFHFAPGRSFSNGPVHVHDLDNFYGSSEPHSFTHIIHQLRFGPPLEDRLIAKYGGRDPNAWTNHHLNPLDDTTKLTDVRPYNYMYFIKVVSTAYLPLGWDKGSSSGWGRVPPGDGVALGKYGYGAGGSVETHQYSVTSHERPLMGGDDAHEGHQERIHARGGIPGVFFSYDISPMKVINKETRDKSFSVFLVGVCAVIGGTLTVASVFDRFIYEGGQQMKKMKDR